MGLNVTKNRKCYERPRPVDRHAEIYINEEKGRMIRISVRS